jgi:hypothetical protein
MGWVDTQHGKNRIYQLIISLLLILVGILGYMTWTAEPGPRRVIELTQTACQMLEPEPKDHGFTREGRESCAEINAGRVADARVLRIPPGRYTFAVTNRDVDAELAFWLRTEGFDVGNPFHHMYEVSVSGGGIGPGETRTFTLMLHEGSYIYQGPANPTPEYRLEVTR